MFVLGELFGGFSIYVYDKKDIGMREGGFGGVLCSLLGHGNHCNIFLLLFCF